MYINIMYKYGKVYKFMSSCEGNSILYIYILLLLLSLLTNRHHIYIMYTTTNIYIVNVAH